MSLPLEENTQLVSDNQGIHLDFEKNVDLKLLWDFFRDDSDSAFIFSKDGEIVSMNKSAEKLLKSYLPQIPKITVNSLFNEYKNYSYHPWDDLSGDQTHSVELTLNSLQNEFYKVLLKMRKTSIDDRFIFCTIKDLSNRIDLNKKTSRNELEADIMFQNAQNELLRYEFFQDGFTLTEVNKKAREKFEGCDFFKIGEAIKAGSGIPDEHIDGLINCYVTKTDIELEKIIYHINGKMKVFDLHLSFLANHQILLSISDITLPTNLRKAYFDTEIMMESFMNTISEMVFVKNQEGTIKYINKQFADFIGDTAENIIILSQNTKETIDELLNSDSIDREVLTTKKKITSTTYSIDRNNHPHQWEITKFPIELAEGEIHIAGIIRDVTIEIKEKRMLELYTRSFNFTPQGVLIFDIDEKIEYINNRFAELLGFNNKEETPPDISSLSLFSSYPEEVFSKLDTISLDTWKKEATFIDNKGNTIYTQVSFSEILNKRKERTHFVVVAEDITKRKNIEKELIEAKEAAIRADKLKSSFLANFSHEIRTPLNVVVGFSQMLIDISPQTDETFEYIDIIQKSSRSLTSLIEDVVYLAKVEAGDVPIEHEFFDIREFILEFSEKVFIRPDLTLKENVNVHLETPDLSLMLCNDRYQLYMILEKLIENAVKYTFEGEITIGYKVILEAGHWIHIYVKDTGIGIKEQNLDEIFNRFTTFSHSKDKLYGGTGMGLSVVKTLTDLMGGKIKVESTVGKGSLFNIILPFPGEEK